MLIETATLRDLTYIAANMRDEDWREIICQVPSDTRPEEIAAVCLQGEAWVASWKGQPVAAFGATSLSVCALSIWAWGTRNMWRAVPAITRKIVDELVPQWIARGIVRAEARSIKGHYRAHRWMTALNARAVPCPCWGRDREDFVLFSWTVEDWERDVLRTFPTASRASHHGAAIDGAGNIPEAESRTQAQ